MQKKNILLATAMAGMIGLSGCAATHTAVSKRNLDVSTKMSDTVFLDPVTSDKQVVYLQVKNTSDHPEIDIESELASAVQNQGYQVTHSLEEAHYLIQANTLQIGESDLREANEGISGGYGAAVTGAALGGSMTGGGSGRVGTAIIGGLVGMAADAMVEDVYFSMITDVRVSERVEDGVTVTQRDEASLSQGQSGSRDVTSTRKTDWQRYDTRVASVANQVNLDFEDAVPELEEGLVNSISGIL